MRTTSVFHHRVRAAVAACGFALAAAGAAGAQDWGAMAETQVVEVLTQDEDGSDRATKVWIVAVDGRAFIRTAATRWYRNVERDPNIGLRVGEEEFLLRTELVTDAALVERAVAAFREKYGFTDAFMQILRFGEPHVMRLAPRD